MAQIRALDHTSRCMQRLGFLKRLGRRTVVVNTSAMENLGGDLVQTVTRKVHVSLTSERAAYIRQRLYDRAYNSLKRQVADWDGEAECLVAMELQDLYLADACVASRTGKLVQGDSRKYPAFGVALGLIRGGTYSPNTRAFSLLHLTPESELQAFLTYSPEANPLCINRHQGLLLLYALMENDGEVVAPLFCQLRNEAADGFTDRDAGDRLPKIYRALVTRHRTRMLPANERDRLDVLWQTAESVAKWEGKSYTGGGAREEASRVRVEPYVDIGLLSKPDPVRYAYAFGPAGRAWADALNGVITDAEVSEFLAGRFFDTAALAWRIPAMQIRDPDTVASHLFSGWQAIRGTSKYAPIEEMALVAGIKALLDHGLIIEPSIAREALIAYQKAHPYDVRFTVDRLGNLAHASFLKPPSEADDESEV